MPAAQNSALGTVLALKALTSGALVAGSMPITAAALPGAISATVHSILGSMLACSWRMSDARSAGRTKG